MCLIAADHPWIWDCPEQFIQNCQRQKQQKKTEAYFPRIRKKTSEIPMWEENKSFMDGSQSDSIRIRKVVSWSQMFWTVQGGRFIFRNFDSCELSSTWSEAQCVWMSHKATSGVPFLKWWWAMQLFQPCITANVSFYALKASTLNWVFNKSMHGEMHFSGFSSTLSSQTNLDFLWWVCCIFLHLAAV